MTCGWSGTLTRWKLVNTSTNHGRIGKTGCTTDAQSSRSNEAHSTSALACICPSSWMILSSLLTRIWRCLEPAFALPFRLPLTLSFTSSTASSFCEICQSISHHVSCRGQNTLAIGNFYYVRQECNWGEVKNTSDQAIRVYASRTRDAQPESC